MKLADSRLRSALGRSVIQLLPQRWGDGLLTAKQALWWRIVERHWYREHFARDHSKDLLKVTLARLRQDTGPGSLAILEFGCNAGNNLYTLRRDSAAGGIDYCGIDINPKAIAFAKAHFPSDSFHTGDHRWFINHAKTLGSFHLFVASHVLYYIDEKHTRSVLDAARKVADYILVADRMQRFFSGSGERNGLFTHPYARICADIGLDVLEMSQKEDDPYGYFLARTGRQTPDSVRGSIFT
jgi:SAM-dependent methyltransferase